MSRRSGVTLLEVLFAIAIATVGILGIMATMVVAGKLATDGARFDAAARVGKNAVREFVVRGFANATGPQGTWATVPVAGQAYCLDPLYVAVNGSMSPACWFPAFDPTALPGPRMNRVSVRALPGDQSVSPLPPIGLEMADAIFTTRDDLVFSVPGDRTLPPVQHYGPGAEIRNSEGKLSWFATVEADNYDDGDGLLCIAVSHRRDVSEADRLVAIEMIQDNEFKLACRSGQPSTDLATHDGDWVLLCGVNPAGRIEYRWHAVLSTTAILEAGTPDYDGSISTVPTRRISTFGRDWTIPPASTQVALFGCVVAVFEKTIKLRR